MPSWYRLYLQLRLAKLEASMKKLDELDAKLERYEQLEKLIKKH